MKATKIAMAILISALGVTPILAQTSASTAQPAAVMTTPLSDVLAALNTMSTPLDVQPATPDPATLQLAGSNFADVALLMASLPQDNPRVVLALEPGPVHATLQRASY